LSQRFIVDLLFSRAVDVGFGDFRERDFLLDDEEEDELELDELDELDERIRRPRFGVLGGLLFGGIL